MIEVDSTVLLVPAVCALVSLARYVAYLLLVRHVSCMHGVAGLEALRFVAAPASLPTRTALTSAAKPGGGVSLNEAESNPQSAG